MNNDPRESALDQTDEDVLNCEIPDEALEAAAAPIGGTIPTGSVALVPPNCC